MLSDETKINNVLSYYVRFVDIRDANSLGKLFINNATIETFNNFNNKEEILGRLNTSKELIDSFHTMMISHGYGEYSHHVTTDRIIEYVSSDVAKIDAQFLMFKVKSYDSSSQKSSITPLESGYYKVKLKKVNNQWKISKHQVYLDFLDK